MSNMEDATSSSIPLVAAVPTDGLNFVDIGDALPDDRVEDGSVLLMPGEDARPTDQVDWSGIKNVYILDCRWSQCYKVLQNSPKLRSLPKVVIQNYTSQFWRPHGQKFEGCLCSAECYYYLMKEVDRRLHSGQNLDSILTYFVY